MTQINPRPCGKEPGTIRLNDTPFDRISLWYGVLMIVGGGVGGLAFLWLRFGGCCL